MTVDWGDYEPFDPGVDRPLHELPRHEAKAAYDRVMAAKDQRVDALRDLLWRNGIDLHRTDAGIQHVNDWFRAEVEPSPTNSSRLRSTWYSVVNDLALWLGDVIIGRAPNVHWTFFDKGAKDVAFQRHVLVGFSKVPNAKYNVDVDRLIATYGHRIVARQNVKADAFVRWVHAAADRS